MRTYRQEKLGGRGGLGKGREEGRVSKGRRREGREGQGSDMTWEIETEGNWLESSVKEDPSRQKYYKHMEDDHDRILSEPEMLNWLIYGNIVKQHVFICISMNKPPKHMNGKDKLQHYVAGNRDYGTFKTQSIYIIKYNPQ